MISSATDVTCSVVKKGSSEAKVVVTASDKVVFILRMNARLPDETSFEAEQVCSTSNEVCSTSNVASSESNVASSTVEVITKRVNRT